MTILVILITLSLPSLVPNPSRWKTQKGMATIYHPGDGHCGTHRADGKRFKVVDDHIAHRWLPLGTTVVVENLWTRQQTSAVVRDRGPFGFCHHKVRTKPVCPSYPKVLKRGKPCPKGYEWVIRTKRKPNECGFWRGIADMTRPLAKRIGATGFTPIRLSWMRRLPNI